MDLEMLKLVSLMGLEGLLNVQNPLLLAQLFGIHLYSFFIEEFSLLPW